MTYQDGHAARMWLHFGFCGRLQHLCESIPTLNVGKNDDAGFMANACAMKQREHLATLGMLVYAQRYADATVIASTMMEGMALLKWAMQKPDARARKWKAGVWVAELALLERMHARGEALKKDDEQSFFKKLKLDSKPLIRKAGMNLNTAESYHRHWHTADDGTPLDIAAVVAELEPELNAMYTDLAGAVHASAHGIAQGMEGTLDRTRTDWVEPSFGALALAAAFTSCVKTFELLATRLNFPQLEAFQTLHHEWQTTTGGV